MASPFFGVSRTAGRQKRESPHQQADTHASSPVGRSRLANAAQDRGFARATSAPDDKPWSVAADELYWRNAALDASAALMTGAGAATRGAAFTLFLGTLRETTLLCTLGARSGPAARTWKGAHG